MHGTALLRHFCEQCQTRNYEQNLKKAVNFKWETDYQIHITTRIFLCGKLCIYVLQPEQVVPNLKLSNIL